MNDDRPTRWSRGFWHVAFRVIGAFVLSASSLAALGCHGLRVSLISESVLLRARWKAEIEGEDVPEKSTSRVLLYRYELERDQEATSADTSDLLDPLICKNRCWLFFVDFYPNAHFAHTTAVALYDLETKRIDVRLAKWWPAVERNKDGALVPIFRTFAERSSQDDQVYPPSPFSMILDKPLPMPTGAPFHQMVAVAADIVPDWSLDEERLSVSPRWALLVQGCSDQSDTFRDDISRAETVLNGIGVPEENIEIIKPVLSATDSSCIISVELGIRQLIGKIHDSGNGCEELVVYFSSHAREDSPSGGLYCSYNVNDLVDERYLRGDQLAEWLEYFGPQSECIEDKPVACENVTVVLQSCYSGSYIGEVKDSLQGVNRVIVTSSDAEKLSYTDLDDSDDPNEGDVGSEFSSGFWEAYGRRGADGIILGTEKDFEIDVVEAFTYAENNDLSRIWYQTNPRKVVEPEGIEYPRTLLKTVANVDSDNPPSLRINILDIENGHPEPGNIDENTPNRILVSLENTSNHHVPVTSVRINLISDDGLGREVGHTELLDGLMPVEDPPQLMELSVEWMVPKCVHLDEKVSFCLVADSPVLTNGSLPMACLEDVLVIRSGDEDCRRRGLFGCTH